MTAYHDPKKVVNRYINPWGFVRDVTTIPCCLLRMKGLSLNAKLTWAILARVSGGKNCAYPKIETIGDELDLSKSTILRSVEELCEQGFLERKRRFQRSNVYYFLNHPVFHGFFSDLPDEPGDDAPDPTAPLPLDGGPVDDLALLQVALNQYMERPGGGCYTARPLNAGVLQKIIMAGNGATVQEIIEYLGWMYNHERQPRHQNGPKDWGWFVKAIGQRFGHPTYADPVPTHASGRERRSALKATGLEEFAGLIR